MSPSDIDPKAGGLFVSRTAYLERLYREEAPRLARYFRRHLRGGDDVSDLVQETFARLASAKHQNVARPVAYMQRIARNLLFDRARRQQSTLSLVDLAPGDYPHLSIAPLQEQALDASDMLGLYRRALSELPIRTRDVFLLHRMDELSYKDIAKRMTISIPTVQYHVARALVHIDKVLDEG